MNVPKGKGARRSRRDDVPEGQLPQQLFDHGLQAAHRYPLVGGANKKIEGRRSPDEAWEDWPYIESQPPHVYAAMVFDIDDPDRWEHEVDGPMPNWQIRKDRSRPTYHVAYTLEIPVARHNAALLKPLHFYRDVYDGLAVRISADCRYSGLMMKNPLNPPSDCTVQWFRSEPYTLAELREWLPDRIPKPIIKTGVGRNEDLFRHCVKVAHQPKWARIIQAEGYAGQWLEHVRLLNVQEYAENPLDDSECRSIAKSCAKYSLRNYSEEIFSEIQARRGAKGAQQRWHSGEPEYDYAERWKSVEMCSRLGYSQAEIGAMFGIAVRTVKSDLQKARLSRGVSEGQWP